MSKLFNLKEWIIDNPDCVFILDNDMWFAHPEKNPYMKEDYISMTDEDWENHENWNNENELNQNDFEDKTNLGYVCHSNYGGGILSALAEIVGIELESA